MTLIFYYRNSEKKLVRQPVNGCEDYRHGFGTIINHLENTKTVHYTPILCLIQGGKQ